MFHEKITTGTPDTVSCSQELVGGVFERHAFKENEDILTKWRVNRRLEEARLAVKKRENVYWPEHSRFSKRFRHCTEHQAESEMNSYLPKPTAQTQGPLQQLYTHCVECPCHNEQERCSCRCQCYCTRQPLLVNHEPIPQGCNHSYVLDTADKENCKPKPKDRGNNDVAIIDELVSEVVHSHLFGTS